MQPPKSTLLYQWPKFFTAISIMLALSMGHAFGNASLQNTAKSSNKLWVIGHRGAAGLAPENTLAAFSKALDIGVDAVELDVHLSLDLVPVVYHDFTLKPQITRTPDGEWLDMWTPLPLKSLSVADLKAYNVGRLNPDSSYAKRYLDQMLADNQRIPTLTEVIRLIKSKPTPWIQIWIEIKTSPEKPAVSGDPEAVAQAVLTVLQKENFIKRTKILSFDWRALIYVQKMNASIPTVYLSHVGTRFNNIKPGQPGPSPWMAGIDIDDFNGSIPLAIKTAGGRVWAPFYKYITPKNLKTAHDLGLTVFVWTPDRKHDMDALFKIGVDGIITNRPDILKTLLE